MSELSESEFRKKNQWYSFTSAAWGALGMAAFFGAFGTISSGLISVATGAPAFAMGMPTAAAALMTGIVPYLAIATLIGIGIGCIYMSQSAATELRVIQDDHMAKQQAKCMQHIHDVPVPTIVKSNEKLPEYEQNQRSDGKTWVKTTEGIDTSKELCRAV